MIFIYFLGFKDEKIRIGPRMLKSSNVNIRHPFIIFSLTFLGVPIDIRNEFILNSFTKLVLFSLLHLTSNFI